MAIETLSISLTSSGAKGKSLIAGDKDDNQIVTVLDGGNLGHGDGEVKFEFWGRGSPTEPGAGPGGDDRFILDLSGFDDDFTITVKSMDAGDVFQINNFQTWTIAGSVHTFTYTGSDGNSHTLIIEALSANGDNDDIVQVVCFGHGTGILTNNGEVPVETLKAGDLVKCGDGAVRPIRWIGGRKVDADMMALHPSLRPVELAQGSLGKDLPTQVLRLSQQHRVVLRDWRAELLFGCFEVMVTAKSLVNDTDIRKVSDENGIEYFHILLDDHQSVFANGVECESLMPADLAKRAMTVAARSEIYLLFPELVTDLSSYGPVCHMALISYEATALMDMRNPTLKP